jgi:60 kDa SS-A/Ro ribonucleoprotein
MNPYMRISTRQTGQTEPIPGKDMVKNNAGGFGFTVDDWKRLDRFLILGSEGGTYYVQEHELTKQNAEVVVRCAEQDGLRTVARIVEISHSGRAPKNDPALFALAICTGLGDAETRRRAMSELPKVARIGTHLFHFVTFMEQFRGWGRVAKEGIQAWYQGKDAPDLAYQLAKYQSRDGWSHRDLLRLAKPVPKDNEHSLCYGWAVGKEADLRSLPLLDAVERAKKAEDAKTICALIRDANLPRECIPTEWLSETEVWAALLEKMPLTAMIRNLATMTRVGLIRPMSEAVRKIVGEVTNPERLRKARVHPIQILAALRTYAQGVGVRGQHTWTPVREVIDALDAAFYLAFDIVEPTHKRYYLGCDVSGSMWYGGMAGMTGVTPGVATGALAMVTAKTEPFYVAGAFNDGMLPFTLSDRQRLDDVCHMMENLDWGGTDCAQPMLDAMERKIEVDCFVIYTDCETWAGRIHPCQALDRYRQKTGIGAKLVVVGMVATEFSIADPNDGGMLDVVGFDTAVPTLISDFCRE